MNCRQLGCLLTVCLFAALNTSAVVLCVDVNSASPTPRYTNWVAAVTNIQDAMDVALESDQILVTNGVYQTGGSVVFGALLTNRVVVQNSLAVGA